MHMADIVSICVRVYMHTYKRPVFGLLKQKTQGAGQEGEEYRESNNEKWSMCSSVYSQTAVGFQ